MTSHPNQPVENVAGVLRFKPNHMVRHLLDTHPQVDLNTLACLNFSDEDRQQLAQLIGYSVSGWGDLPYVSEEARATVELMQSCTSALEAEIAALKAKIADMEEGWAYFCLNADPE